MKKVHCKYCLLSLAFYLLLPHNSFSQTLERRIDSLLNLMTQDEKLAQLYNNANFTTPNNTRLNIPGFVMDDGPHGVRYQTASAFPTGIAVAATWDRTTAFEIGKAMGEEFHAFKKHQQLGPCIDLCRDPRAGRNAETGGEDPYLCGQIGAWVTKGIQTTPVIATVKHFMVESKQAYRDSCNEIFTDRWANEHYGYNFRTVVQEGAVLSVMDSYNLINGVHAAESNYLLDTLLRQRWGFPFYVVSDWSAVHDSKLAITAGTDVCMGNKRYQLDLPNLVSSSQVPVSVIDECVRRVLRTKILSGMLDYYPPGKTENVNSTEHQQICLQGARESIILLKNSGGILPLNKATINKVALIGPDGDASNLNCFGSSETTPVYSVSIKKGLENKLGVSKVSFLKGCDINGTSESGFAAAKDLAAQSDVVIFAGGLDATQEGEKYGTGNDRKSGSADLPGMQQDLINQLAEVNPNIIVVVQSGGVCSMHKAMGSMKALVYSFYAAQEAGNAIADVLFGDYNPAGRMPVTMPTGDDQLPPWNDDFTDDYGCGYRWFDQNGLTPEFPFGFGLSYTTFTYSNLRVSSNSLPAGAPLSVSADVENSGPLDGDEVVELYLSNKSSSVWMPGKELKGFERVHLARGEKKTVNFTLTSEEFYYWNETDKAFEVNPGVYVIGIGGSSDNLPLIDTVELTSSTGKPDLKITRIFTMPRFPLPGQNVTFYAYIKNQGNSSILPDKKFSISFVIDSSMVAEARDVSIGLNPGQAALISATQNKWTAPSNRGYQVCASVDASGGIDEWIESNNQFTGTVQVYDSTGNTRAGFFHYRKNVVEVKARRGCLIINCGKSVITSIVVNDLQGKVLFRCSEKFTGMKRIDTRRFKTGALLVTCKRDGAAVVSKTINSR